MGQEQSAEQKTQQQKQLLLQYSQEREYQHPQFGTVKLYTHIQTNDLICVKNIYTKCDTELQQLYQKLTNRNTYEHNNLLKILAIRKHDQIQICSASSSITIVIECYIETLFDEIKIRKINNKPYSEGHIWILLQQIIDPCSYLEERKCFHGDIKPSTVYLDENGGVKLVECSLLQNGLCAFDKMIQSIDKAYLSPLLLQQYHSTSFSPKHNPFKSDVYSLGLTVLSVILLEEVYDCYDFLNGTILQHIIEEKFVRVRNMGYSQMLIQFIRQLLIEDENERPSWTQLKEYVDKYRDKIFNMIPFYQPAPQSKSPFRINYLVQNKFNQPLQPMMRSPKSHTQQFNTSRSDTKPKYIHICKENY